MSPKKAWLSGSKVLEAAVALISLTLRSPFRRIPKMQGGSEMALSALATLTPTTVKQVWATPPIEVDFQIKGYMASGLTAQYLRVTEDSNYESAKWVRYLTEANGSYQARVSSLFPSFGDVGLVTDLLTISA